MPTYQFHDTLNDEIVEIFMSISLREEFMQEHPHMEPIMQAPSIVSGVSLTNKVPDGFKDVLSKIAEKNPYTDFHDRYGHTGIKEARTKQIVKKHVDRITKSLKS